MYVSVLRTYKQMIITILILVEKLTWILVKLSEDLAIMLLATILTNTKQDEDGYYNRRTANVTQLHRGALQEDGITNHAKIWVSSKITEIENSSV